MTDTSPLPVTHLCPGGCGTRISNSLLACPKHWYMLPGTLRDSISGAWHRMGHASSEQEYEEASGAHADFIDEAMQWYRQNTR